MTEIIWQLYSIDAEVYYITAALVLAVCWFIREIVGTGGLALVAAPILMASGIATHLGFRAAMVTLVSDKTSNSAMIASIGVLAGLVLLIAVKWGLTIWKEYRVRSTKIEQAGRAGR